jgi:hypothetical protein
VSEQLVRRAVEGVRVEAAKIIFFGFSRTEEDALDAVTLPST